MAGHGKSAIGSQTKGSNRSGFKEHWDYFKAESVDASNDAEKENIVHIYSVFGKKI